MKLAELLPSTYLKKEDFESPKLLTIAGLERVNVAQDGYAPEWKWCMQFQEEEKGLILNTTNIQTLGAILGDESDAWMGKKIVGYHDPSVSFGGKLVGGVRLRAPKNQPTQAKPAPVKDPFADLSEDVPY